ncbi:GTP-binding protein [Candidatus Woesearchaeota archaeon]|nr:MAG: GTP-binding protein [Candidatus Woesearchaeota archaeon]
MAKEATSKKDAQSRIKELEEELRKTPYNKRTQHHIGLIKAQIAKLREKQERQGKGKGKHEGYSIRKTGDGTVVLVGFPSSGKSTLLNKITKTESRTGNYDFTTLNVVPGLLEYRHAKIQVLDVPGIVRGAASGKGRGKEVISVIRNADLIVVLIDATQPKQLKFLKKELFDAGIRMNEKKPDVKITRTSKNGIVIGTTKKLTRLSKETIKGIMKEFKIINADVVIRDNITDDQLIDCIEGNRAYIKGVIVVNKIDLLDKERLDEVKKMLKPDLVISAEHEIGVEELKELIFERLDLIRIYLKQPGKPADLKEPLIMFKSCTVEDVCNKLHKDFVRKFRFCRVWGKSSKFDGQRFNLKHILADEDILEIHLS